MSNNMYDKGREKFARAQVNWETDEIKTVLVDTGTYTFSQAHEFLSDISVAARISSVQTLSGKSAALGACDANDVTFPAVAGASIEAIIVFKGGANDAASPLLAFIDTATGLPITPNTGDIIVNWDNGPNKIFKV